MYAIDKPEYKVKLWELNHVNDFKKLYDFKDKAVLEIGGHLPKLFVNEMGVKSWTCIDPWTTTYEDGNYREIKGDIASYELEENTFDLIFSTNCFEHILELEKAFANMYKILKPGGMVSALFGPIWSSNRGHHLFVIDNKTQEVIFFNDDPIPQWSHLYMNKEELTETIKDKFDEETLKTIVLQALIYKDKNRLFYEDYIKIINNSNFEIHELRNWHEPLSPPADIQKKIEEKNPNYKNFSTRSLKILLKKPLN